MSYQDGLMAMQLEMPPRVPRTEYSIESHWAVVKAVTGIDVNEYSDDAVKTKASLAFKRAWNFDFIWSIEIGSPELMARHTNMGHAVYAAGGVDYDDKIQAGFTDPEEVFLLDMEATYPRQSKKQLIERFERQWNKIRETHDAVPTTGIYITLMSGLIDMLGWDMLLLCAGEDRERFGQVAQRYANWVYPFFEALAESNVPTVMIHDDIVWTSGAFINPNWYRKYLFTATKRLLSPLREAGKIIAYTSDGDYTEFIDDIAACGVSGFVLEPLTDMQAIADRWGKTHFFIGNADTRILLSGSRDDIRREVERCMAIGKQYPGFFMAVGNHIPSNTPVENALYYNECYEKLSRR
jgi:uroporphyrinogen-III decarboxylase